MEKITRMTLEEISEQIGISRTTIYKVLKDKGNVSEKTRAVVMEALEKYHYVENKNARNLALNRQYAIGYAGFRSKSAAYFSTEVRKGISRAVQEFGDDGLSILVSEFDLENPWQQLEEVERMLAQGAESFVLAYSDSRVIEEIIDRLENRGCRFVLLSRDLVKAHENYYVGVDYYKSGLLAAELLGKMVSGKGRIFIPVTPEYHDNQDIQARLKGFLDKMKGYPGCEVLPAVHDLMEGDAIYRAVSGCVNSQPYLSGIFDLTYRLDMTARALKDLGREDIKLVGFDLFGEIEQDIAAGVIDAVVYQDLSRQAYLGIKILFEEMCYGIRHEEKKFYSKLEIVMSENLCYF
ncbi:LacI family DNA-binding transcriptional regulator [Lachnospiraceae bacterium]|jgi:LacI family transcriptional regulator|nr:LacI family DNA-binding transcriptional regulator [Lachnospiraceae bacterium]